MDIKNLKSPISIQLELTENCNNRCIYCYNFWNYEDKLPKIDTRLGLSEFKRIIDKLKEAKIFQVVFTGGEPFLRKDILFDLLEYSRKNDLDLDINTNLVALNGEDINRIGEFCMGFLISFPDCNEKKYNKITGSKNYSKFLKNLELLVKYDNPITVNMVVTRENIDSVYETGKFIKNNFGINNFCATPISGTKGTNNHNNLTLDSNEVLYVLEDLINLSKDFNIIVDSLQPLPFCMYPKEKIEKYKQFLKRSCAAGKTTATISPNGELRPCSHAQQLYGNVFERSIKEVWNDMQLWRSMDIMPDKCKPCDVLNDCMAGCRTSAEYYNGSIKAEDPLTTEAIKNGKSILNVTSLNEKTIKSGNRYKITENIKYRHEGDNIYTVYHSGKTCFVDENILKVITASKFIDTNGLNNKGLIAVTQLLNTGIIT